VSLGGKERISFTEGPGPETHRLNVLRIEAFSFVTFFFFFGSTEV
jgi:hypothetical protein